MFYIIFIQNSLYYNNYFINFTSYKYLKTEIVHYPLPRLYKLTKLDIVSLDCISQKFGHTLLNLCFLKIFQMFMFEMIFAEILCF